ncbi:MAG: CPBP family intramembrane glutamic endopeptidase [Acidimicrobiia bacterium]
MIESSAPPPKPDTYLDTMHWRYIDAVSVFVAGIAGAFIVTIVFAIAGIDPLDPLPFATVFAAQFGGSMLVVWWLSRKRGTGSLSADVGLVIRGKDWWGVPAGFLLQIAVAIITFPIIYLVFGSDPPQQGVSDVAGSATSTAEQLVTLISLAVLAPIVEEIIYRGILLSALRRSLGAWPSILISAAIFGGIHALLDFNAIAAVPGLFLLGIVLAWVALRRGNLSLPIALHSGVNLLAGVFIVWGPQIEDWAETQLDEIEGLIAFLPF